MPKILAIQESKVGGLYIWSQSGLHSETPISKEKRYLPHICTPSLTSGSYAPNACSVWKVDHKKPVRTLAQLYPMSCRLSLVHPWPQNKVRIRCRTAAFPNMFTFREVDQRFLLLQCHAPPQNCCSTLITLQKAHWGWTQVECWCCWWLVCVSQLPAPRILQCKSEVFGWEVFGFWLLPFWMWEAFGREIAEGGKWIAEGKVLEGIAKEGLIESLHRELYT
jgi:hypothetical protein